METYTIKQAYPWQKDGVYQLQISSESLVYSELSETHSGVSTMSGKNRDLIQEKCRKVADLIREIDKLNSLP